MTTNDKSREAFLSFAKTNDMFASERAYRLWLAGVEFGQAAQQHQESCEVDLIREQFTGRLQVKIPTREAMGLTPLRPVPTEVKQPQETDCACDTFAYADGTEYKVHRCKPTEVKQMSGDARPYCSVCNSVRMSHCAAPEYCGNVIYPATPAIAAGGCG